MTAPVAVRTPGGAGPTGPRLIRMIVPGGDADADACRAAVEAEITDWARGAPCVPPDVEVRADLARSVPVLDADGVPMPLSARRTDLAVTLATGRFPEAPGPAPASARLAASWDADPALRPALAAALVAATLRGPAGDLLAPPPGPPDGDPVVPVAEIGEAHLRAVTASPPDDLKSAVTAARNVLYHNYGVAPPGIALAVGIDDRVTFRFAGRRTVGYLLPPQGTVIVADQPDLAGYGLVAAVTDPVTGARWSLRTAESAPAGSMDTVDYLMRALIHECALRLPLWVPASFDVYRTGLWRATGVADTVGRYLPELVTRLVAQRASAQYVEVLAEVVARTLASGVTSLDAMEDAARARLGSAVLGELPLERAALVIDADPPKAGAAPDRLRAAILAAAPRLATTVTPAVVRVPAAARRAVAAALQPLADVVTVVARDELDDTGPLGERWRAMGVDGDG